MNINVSIQAEARKMAQQRYDKQQKQDTIKQAEVAKKIQQEDAARNHLQKAKLANLFLQKAQEQAKEHANKEMEDTLYKSQHGRSSSPLFQHVDATKSHCGGTRGVFFSVLQGVAGCCRVLQDIAVRCSELRHGRFVADVIPTICRCQISLWRYM